MPMKKIVFQFSIICFLLGNTIASSAQNIDGFWNGYATLMGQDLRIVVQVEETPDGLSAVMKSPDQGSGDLPVTAISLTGSQFSYSVESVGLTYEGVFDDGNQVITGNLNQNGRLYPLTLVREVLEKKEIARPKNPSEPFNYTSEEISFKTLDGKYTLSGTLTIPAENITAVVVMVSGSGPQNRDSEILDHKPFWVWADHFAEKGIACLRYDERGVAASEGNFDMATSNDFAKDARAALNFLEKQSRFEAAAIGLVGHSEGGLVASLVGTMEEPVDFLVSLAGMGKDGRTLLEKQNFDIYVSSGLSAEMARYETNKTMALIDLVIATPDSAEAYQAIRQQVASWPEAETNSSVDKTTMAFNSSLNCVWMRNLLVLDPAPYWEKTTCPVLAINGNNDLQVDANANIRAIQFALRRGGNTNGTFKIFPNMNHLFQETEDGSIDLYGKLEQTVSPQVLEYVSDWIVTTSQK